MLRLALSPRKFVMIPESRFRDMQCRVVKMCADSGGKLAVTDAFALVVHQERLIEWMKANGYKWDTAGELNRNSQGRVVHETVETKSTKRVKKVLGRL